MLRARDIMATDVFILDFGASIEEAAWAFSRQNLGGAPVRDADGRIVGFLSRRDVVNPAWADWVPRKKATVGDIMTPNLLSIAADTSALHVARGMVEKGIHHVIVLDEDQHVVGMISSLDIVKAVARGLQFDETPAATQVTAVRISDAANSPGR